LTKRVVTHDVSNLNLPQIIHILNNEGSNVITENKVFKFGFVMVIKCTFLSLYFLLFVC